MQNETSGNIILRKLIQMVKKAGFFSVIAANDEQLSICIRFVCDGLPCERFFAFHEGEAIAEDILSKITEWQLHPQLLCGQAYDGAGAMAGKSKLLV